jgi:hypothetical protein
MKQYFQNLPFLLGIKKKRGKPSGVNTIMLGLKNPVDL